MISLLPTHATADPPTPTTLHIVKGAQCTTDGGTNLRLDPGYYVPDVTWRSMDAEVMRLQESETRLSAENAHLRTDVKPDVFSWKTATIVAGALIVGMSAGVYWF